MAHSTTTRTATAKQVAYLASLFDALIPRRDDPAVQAAVAPHITAITAARSGTDASFDAVSAAITALKALASPVRSNRYPGKCGNCGHNVPEGAGRIAKLDGRWYTYHVDGECPSTPAPASAPRSDEAGAPLTPGFYRATDGGTWEVRQAKHGGLYALAGTLLPDVKPSWEYVKGGMRNLAGAHPLSADEAAAIGALTHHCVFCSRRLTDDGEGRSVEVGYGPICAQKHGLPWGA